MFKKIFSKKSPYSSISPIYYIDESMNHKNLPRKEFIDSIINNNLIFAICVIYKASGKPIPNDYMLNKFLDKKNNDFQVQQMQRTLDLLSQNPIDNQTKYKLSSLLDFIDDNREELLDHATRHLGVTLNLEGAVREILTNPEFNFNDSTNKFNIEWNATLNQVHKLSQKYTENDRYK